MSLLPHTLLNATTNEDQTLEIHSEILEPLSHSQLISRFEIPHKNILDSDSILIWNVNCNTGFDATGLQQVNLPHLWSGLYDTLKRARLYVNGKIISELNEVGKYLAIKNHFTPHEVKTELNDIFSYSNNNIRNDDGLLNVGGQETNNTPGSRRLGPSTATAGHDYPVECSLKLHQLFAVLKDAQLDTNNIEGKIMIELDWEPLNSSATNSPVQQVGAGLDAANKVVTVSTPRLILDFLTYNAEVQAQIKNAIYGDGPGVNMPYREIALVRKTLPAGLAGANLTLDMNIGMTGRAVQKIYVAKVMNCAGNDVQDVLGESRSDLLQNQSWNIRINDLMIYDRDVNNRAEEFNYLQQTGEKQFTCPPQTFESRAKGIINGNASGDYFNYVQDDNLWGAAGNIVKAQITALDGGIANHVVGVPLRDMLYKGDAAQAGDYSNNNEPIGKYTQGANLTAPNFQQAVCGRLNYLGVNLARYKSGAESPINAMRIGSTPIVMNLTYGGQNDANTSRQSGNAFIWVEYLKLMNLKNGQVSVVDM
jgi:hypothetical protein